MAEEIRVKIKNKKGLLLVGVLHVPAGEGKRPAVITLHGFTGYKEEKNSVSLARELSERGFMVIRFDCSGSGESEGTMKDDYRMTNYISDIDSVYQFIYNHPRVDAKRIGVWGHSMGAMLAVIFGSKHPELKAICAVSPPKQMGTTDWLAQFLDDWKRTGWFTKVSTSGHGESRVPWAFMEDAAQYNTLDYAGDVRSPLMVILGLAEDTVPPEHTREIFRKADEPKELVEIPGMSHNYKKFPKYTRRVNDTVIPFFEKYLK
ncbi:MAG: alpha/beta fold hydrolase [Patescibacteria group bacterium]